MAAFVEVGSGVLDPHATVHEAVLSAASGGTVLVCPGRHDLSLEGGTLALTETITLRGIEAPTPAVLDVNGSGPVVQVGDGVRAWLLNLTLTGSTDSRGLLLGQYADAMLEDSVVTGTEAAAYTSVLKGGSTLSAPL